MLTMIQELAEYEKELDQVKMTVERLQKDGWPEDGKVKRFETLMAEVDGAVIG